MKKTITALTLILIVSCFFTSCKNKNNNVSILKQEIEEADKMCPINSGMIGDIISFKYDDNAHEVQVVFSVNESILDLKSFKSNSQLIESSKQIFFANKEQKKLLKSLIEANSGIAYIYKSNTSEDSFKIALSVDELKKIQNNPLTDEDYYKAVYQYNFSLESSRCPYNIDEGTKLIKIYENGNDLIYEYIIDEQYVDIDVLNQNKELMKEGQKKILSEPALRLYLEALVNLDKNIKSHFKGNHSSKKIIIEITNDELSGIKSKKLGYSH